MKPSGWSPITCGPTITPAISSTTTTGSTIPRVDAIAASVPDRAAASTIVRNLAGDSVMTTAATLIARSSHPT